ncbi:hypothetical protein DSO57_1003412 [Entomophthora muscae]|uniref:Uncharacterized protein n=1 Tax=Entomophthora muscae TaxID=34485 RepID=A0ACC2TJV2_9FUNG|nr:hypothetical protein DSO57_1003412 [Entomophthora muscae]
MVGIPVGSFLVGFNLSALLLYMGSFLPQERIPDSLLEPILEHLLGVSGKTYSNHFLLYLSLIKCLALVQMVILNTISNVTVEINKGNKIPMLLAFSKSLFETSPDQFRKDAQKVHHVA